MKMFPVEIYAHFEDGIIAIEQLDAGQRLAEVRLTPEQADIVCDWIQQARAELQQQGQVTP